MNEEERQRIERMKRGIWKAKDGEWLLALVERLDGELRSRNEAKSSENK